MEFREDSTAIYQVYKKIDDEILYLRGYNLVVCNYEGKHVALLDLPYFHSAKCNQLCCGSKRNALCTDSDKFCTLC